MGNYTFFRSQSTRQRFSSGQSPKSRGSRESKPAPLSKAAASNNRYANFTSVLCNSAECCRISNLEELMEDPLEDVCESLHHEVDTNKLSDNQRRKMTQMFRLQEEEIDKQSRLSQPLPVVSSSMESGKNSRTVHSLTNKPNTVRNQNKIKLDEPKKRQTTQEKSRGSKFDSIMRNIETHRLSQQEKGTEIIHQT